MLIGCTTSPLKAPGCTCGIPRATPRLTPRSPAPGARSLLRGTSLAHNSSPTDLQRPPEPCSPGMRADRHPGATARRGVGVGAPAPWPVSHWHGRLGVRASPCRPGPAIRTSSWTREGLPPPVAPLVPKYLLLGSTVLLQ